MAKTVHEELIYDYGIGVRDEVGDIVEPDGIQFVESQKAIFDHIVESLGVPAEVVIEGKTYGLSPLRNAFRALELGELIQQANMRIMGRLITRKLQTMRKPIT